MVDYLVGNKDVLVCNKIYFILNGVLKWFIKWVNLMDYGMVYIY